MEYHIGDRVFTDWNTAAGFALSLAAAGKDVALDVVIYTESDALAFGGDDALERYRQDSEASVFERLEIRAHSVGSVA